MHMRRAPGGKSCRAVVVLIALSACSCAAYTDSIFSKANYYPTVWFAINGQDVPGIANNALQLRADTADPDAFSQDVIVALARGQRSMTAKAIGYMINANSTYGGGCPNPAPPINILQRFGRAFAAAIVSGDNQTGLWGTSLADVAASLNTPNVTAASLKAVNGSVVADTILGGLFAASRSCTRPNSLTGSSQAAVVAKYVDATCFYAGYILRALTNNDTRDISALDRTFATDVKIANVTDRYVTSPVLQAFQQCRSGPASVLRPPSWLGESFAQVSIDESNVGALNAGNEGSISGGGISSEGSISGLTTGGSALAPQSALEDMMFSAEILQRMRQWQGQQTAGTQVAG